MMWSLATAAVAIASPSLMSAIVPVLVSRRLPELRKTAPSSEVISPLLNRFSRPLPKVTEIAWFTPPDIRPLLVRLTVASVSDAVTDSAEVSPRMVPAFFRISESDSVRLIAALSTLPI